MIYKQKNIYIYIYEFICASLWTKRGKRKFLSSGLVSDCVVVYNILNISFDLLRQEDKDYVPILYFCFPVAACRPSQSFFFSTSERNKAERVAGFDEKGKSVEIPVISVISVGISALWADHSVLCEIWGGSRDRVPRRSAQRQPSQHSQHAQTPPLLQVPRMLWGDPYGCPA